MKNAKLVLLFAFILASAFLSGLAEANGTLTVVFKYKDAGGVETPLASAYIYLRPDTEEPPKEIFFRDAAYVLGPSDANGVISASVPEGRYYVRITRRNPLDAEPRPFGPPEASDYTWHQTGTITISTNTVTDLGTRYAGFFGSVIPEITISGTVANANTGGPAPNRYVRAQSTPCVEANYAGPDPAFWVDSNHCGPDKALGYALTDANGNYTLYLRREGSFYIYSSSCLGDQHVQYQGNVCVGTPAPAPMNVRSGDKKMCNFSVTR